MTWPTLLLANDREFLGHWLKVIALSLAPRSLPDAIALLALLCVDNPVPKGAYDAPTITLGPGVPRSAGALE